MAHPFAPASPSTEQRAAALRLEAMIALIERREDGPGDPLGAAQGRQLLDELEAARLARVLPRDGPVGKAWVLDLEGLLVGPVAGLPPAYALLHTWKQRARARIAALTEPKAA